jgi:hypothetical protein
MLNLNEFLLVIFCQIVQIVPWGKRKSMPSAGIKLFDSVLMEGLVKGVSQSKDLSVFGAFGRHGLTDR